MFAFMHLTALAGMIQKQRLMPAAKRLGLEGIGWHTFRHTYRSLPEPMGSFQRLHVSVRYESLYRVPHGGALLPLSRFQSVHTFS
jgi:hypothetical protein